jgi:hypothetical protein
MIDAKILLNESSYSLMMREYLAIFEAVFSGRHIISTYQNRERHIPEDSISMQ